MPSGNPALTVFVKLIARLNHRNLRSRTSMLAWDLQIFFGKEHLVKNWLISTLDKVIYFKGTIFQSGLQKLSSLHKIGWRLAEKIYPFFKHASSRFLWFECNRTK
jgi:hypothetical protein